VLDQAANHNLFGFLAYTAVWYGFAAAWSEGEQRGQSLGAELVGPVWPALACGLQPAGLMELLVFKIPGLSAFSACSRRFFECGAVRSQGLTAGTGPTVPSSIFRAVIFWPWWWVWFGGWGWAGLRSNRPAALSTRGTPPVVDECQHPGDRGFG